MDALENAANSHTPSEGGEIIPVGPCDVTKKDDLEKLVQEISRKEKHINVLSRSPLSLRFHFLIDNNSHKCWRVWT